jgi:hypothetical protein
MSWKSDSSRFTSTTWPTPLCTATRVAKAADSAGDLVGERDRRQQRRAVGLAVHGREADMASASVAKPGRAA